jgi:hypothetical protein
MITTFEGYESRSGETLLGFATLFEKLMEIHIRTPFTLGTHHLINYTLVLVINPLRDFFRYLHPSTVSTYGLGG